MSVALGPYLTVWTILALNVLSPGPNVLNTITTAMGSGRAAGLASALAVGPGIAAWCLGMSLGVAVMFRTVPGAEAALTLLAAGLLIWFALRYLRAALFPREAALKARDGLGLRASFLRSLSINATNPKALTTWIAILGLFPVAGAGAADIAVLALGSAGVGFAIHVGYALAFSTRAAARAYLRAAPAINGAVGVFFVLFAGKLVAGLVPG